MAPSPLTRRVLDAVRRSLGAGWACIEEVEQIDLLAVGLWRSTGHRTLGVEVKVSRSDWLRELAHPEKARTDVVDAYALATLDHVVRPGELPAGWGHMVVRDHGNSTRVFTLALPGWSISKKNALERTPYRSPAMLRVQVARRAAYAEADARALIEHWPGTPAELAAALESARERTGRLLPGVGVYRIPVPAAAS